MNWHTLLILFVYLAGMLTTGILVLVYCVIAIRRERRDSDVLDTLNSPRYGP